MFTPRGKRFRPRKFLKLATQLIADNNYEEPSRIRTAVGRAYYAAFLYTKDKLKRLSYILPDDSTVHQVVVDVLMDGENTRIGSKLHTLLEQRRIADYYTDTRISKGRGNFCMRLSEEVIDTAELLRR